MEHHETPLEEFLTYVRDADVIKADVCVGVVRITMKVDKKDLLNILDNWFDDEINSVEFEVIKSNGQTIVVCKSF